MVKRFKWYQLFLSGGRSPSTRKRRYEFLKDAILVLLVLILFGMYTHTQLRTSYVQPSKPVPRLCVFPQLNPHSNLTKRFIETFPPLTCESEVPNLVYLAEKFLMKINYTKVNIALRIATQGDSFKGCILNVIERQPGSDFELVTTKVSPMFNDSIELNKYDEHFAVECFTMTMQRLSNSYFSLIRPRPKRGKFLKGKYEKHVAKNAPKETLSILMIGIDGMSKQNLERAMPKTRNYLLNVMNATELHKHNKIDDNTFPNVMPLLTGRFANDFLNQSWTWEDHFDKINDAFIWSEYKEAGYRTALILDGYTVTAFHYEKKGWDHSPVHYYMRPTMIASENDPLMKGMDENCMGDIPRDTWMLDYWLQLTSIFNNTKTRPYFGYSFSVHLTHDDFNMASQGDDIYHSFLQELTHRNVLNNTVIIFFSDHGPRFGGLRSTYHGMIEGRTPYTFLVFPPWFHEKYPHLIKTLKINQDRLTSHFDVHATMRDILFFKGQSGQGDVTQRGISLFKEIPEERTCEHIGIKAEYCVCNFVDSASTDISPNVGQYFGVALKDKVVNFTVNYREQCATLNLVSVKNVIELKSASTFLDEKTYIVTIVTEPGEAIYEGKVTFHIADNQVEVRGDVTRLNMYRGQAECIQNPKLRPYCYCVEEVD